MMTTFEPRLDILPAAQRKLWPELTPVQHHGFVLYRGTAIALRLGHRQSVDFDFFSSRPIDQAKLRAALPFLRQTTVRQDQPNTFEVATKAGVKVSFFGGLDFGRVGEPQRTTDGVLRAASMADLMATKLKVILQRSEAKDYQDIAAMVRAGIRLDTGLAAAEKIFQPTFAPSESLKALVYFEGGDMKRLSASDRATLVETARSVKTLPSVVLKPELAPRDKVVESLPIMESIRPRTPRPRPGPSIGL